MKKKNLLKLANYLENNVTQEMFDMKLYRMDSKGNSVIYTSKAECGTVGCALGYGPFVIGLETKEEDFIRGSNYHYLAFYYYCKRVFNLDSDINSERWEFLFGSDWVNHDNTPLGAAARIRYLVEGNSLKGFDSEFLERDSINSDVEVIEELMLNYNLSLVLSKEA